MDTSGNTSNQNNKSIVIFMENQQTPIIVMAARNSIANGVHKDTYIKPLIFSIFI